MNDDDGLMVQLVGILTMLHPQLFTDWTVST